MTEVADEKKITLADFRVCHRVLPLTFRPLGELFTQLTGVRPGALLCLDPHVWAIRFFGVDSQERSLQPRSLGQEFEERTTGILGEELESAIQRHRSGPLTGHQDLFRLIRTLIEAETELTGDAAATYRKMYEGATNLLETRNVLPGNAHWEDDYLIDVDHWKVARHTKPLTRFQDVLDFASVYGFDCERMNVDRGDGSYQPWPAEDPTLLIVESYVERKNLIRGNNVLIFVAEHIQALGRDPEVALARLETATHIDSYFMPLRALGQWRAAFDCKCLGSTSSELDELQQRIEDLKRQSSRLARGSFDDLLTSALINAFALSLHDARDREEFYGIFATLWWSKQIEFFRRTRSDSANVVARVLWCEGTLKLILDKVEDNEVRRIPEGESADDMAEAYGRSHRGWLRVHHIPTQTVCQLILDLGQLAESADQKKILLDRWGFDRVEYLCDLMDPSAEEDFHRWADSLGDQLVAVRRTLAEQIKRENAERAEREYSGALFAFGHHLGNLFLESGLVAFELDPALNKAEDIRNFEQIKTRLMLAWGIGEAIRPMRHGGQGFPDRWFPAEPRPVDAADLARSLQRIARLYLSGICSELNPEWCLGWKLRGEVREEETLAEIMDQVPRLPCLPPFDHEPAGTLAVTLGLAEQLRNMRHNWVGNHEELQDGIDAGKISEIATVSIDVDPESEHCQVRSEFYYFYRKQPGCTLDQSLYSTSIEEIRSLEAKALAIEDKPVTETSQPVSVTSAGRFVLARSTWNYYYGRVVPTHKNRVAPDTREP